MRARRVAREMGYENPTEEVVEYYRRIEDSKAERASRGIPIEPP